MPDASRIRWPVLLGLAVLLARPAAGQVPVVSPGPLHPWPSLNGDPDVRAVELGDVTGDGRVDVVTVGGVLLVPGQLTVHPGLGDGWFAPAVVSGTVGGPRDLALADLDGDGRQDALVAVNGLTVQLADGQGGFEPAQFVQALSNTVESLPGDLDGDGDPDVLLLASTGQARTLLNSAGVLAAAGDTTLGAQVLIGDQAALADLDLDGDLDLALPDAASHTVDLHLGDGLGGFAPATSFATNTAPQGLAVGDTTGDGRPEIVVRGTLASSCVLHVNLGGASYGPPQVLAGGPASTMLLADVDADGDRDLLRWSTPQGFSLAPNPFLGPAAEPVVTVHGLSAAGLRAARLDGDGSLDVVTVTLGTGRVTVLRGDDLVAATPTPSWSAGAAPLQAYGDGDGDGRDDLWALDGDVLSFAASSGAFSLDPPHVLGLGDLQGAALELGDVDGDGRQDAVLLGLDGLGVPTLRTALGRILGPPQLSPPLGLPSQVAAVLLRLEVADVSGDGLLDALVMFGEAASGPTVLSVALGQGDGTFVPGPATQGDQAPRDLALGELTGNGLLDTAVLMEGVLLLLDGFGSQPVSAGMAYSLGALPDQLALLDVDGDGLDDVLLAQGSGSSASALRWHPVSPGLGLAPAVSLDVPAPVFDLEVADLDRDGVGELLLGGLEYDLLDTAALRGESAPRRLHREAFYAGLLVGDLDGNGLPELIEQRSGGVHAARVSHQGRAWLDLGAGLGAAGGAPPRLAASGAMVVGSANSLDLSGGPAGGLAFLVLSLDRLEAPFKGGVLVPDADLVLANLALDAAGGLLLPFSWPAGSTIPSGTALYAQHWCPLPGGGFVASNALQLWTP